MIWEWTKDHDDLLKKTYETGGIKDCSDVLGRSTSSIHRRMKILKIGSNKIRIWTKEEDLILMNEYYLNGPQGAMNKLNLSEGVVWGRIKKLKLELCRGRRWTEEEDNIIKNKYQTHMLDELSDILNINKSLIFRRAKELGIKKEKKSHVWTLEEDWTIYNRYYLNGAVFIAKILNLRKEQIRARAAKLKIKKHKCKEGFKTCTNCRIDKELKSFSPAKYGKFNVTSECKECKLKIRKENPLKYKKYYENRDKERANKTQREYERKRFVEDPEFHITKKLRSLVRESLKARGIKKAYKTIKLIGIEPVQFIEYFKSKMTPNMKWADVLSGKIHVDHIIPISMFDLTDLEQQRKCFHYTNLQPLWATTKIAIDMGDTNATGNINKGSNYALPSR